MWALLLNFIGGPIIKGVIDGYKAKLEAGNTTDRIAADLAGRELEVQKREAELQTDYKRAIIGRWYEPTNLASYVFVIYFAKCVIWDAMLGMGTTPPIRGNVGEWMGWIAAFLFGQRTATSVATVVAGALRRR